MAIDIKRIINEPINSNCYILCDKSKSDRCIIVDRGSQRYDKIVDVFGELQLIPEYIILTHEHFDHCWSVNKIRERWPEIKLICSQKCSTAIQNERLNYSHYSGFREFRIEPADMLLEKIGWRIEWNGYDVIFEPAKGHTESGIILCIGHTLFTCDTLIKDLATVTKFKTGSFEELKETMRNLSLRKGKDYIVYPGHGDSFIFDDYDLSKAINCEK